jgi:regulator of extracellular matrix RemA (YlzA/DUF370 family)
MTHVGYGNYVNGKRIVAIVQNPGSVPLPVRRIMYDAQDKGMHIDLTKGHKTQSIIIMDTGHVISTSKGAEKIANKTEG